MKYLSILIGSLLLSGCISTAPTIKEAPKKEEPIANFDVLCSTEKSLNAVIYDLKINKNNARNIDLKSYGCGVLSISQLRQLPDFFVFVGNINNHPNTCKFLGYSIIDGKKDFFPMYVWSITENLCTNYEHVIIN